MSLPSRERGLKCRRVVHIPVRQTVAPFAGAWIEISVEPSTVGEAAVAPFAGAWIEISGIFSSLVVSASLPSRERGLKCRRVVHIPVRQTVAPFAGAWIEISVEPSTVGEAAVAPFAGAWIEI